jgi:hypothetical protein
MRVAVVIALAVALAGCEHIYGGLDSGLSDSDAMAIARHEAARRGVPLDGRRAVVRRTATGAMVYFEDPDCDAGCLDGLPVMVEIAPRTRSVTYFHDGRV